MKAFNVPVDAAGQAAAERSQPPVEREAEWGTGRHTCRQQAEEIPYYCTADGRRVWAKRLAGSEKSNHPMKIAAIDIGTNSIHMIVVEVRRDLSFDIVDREKEMVRLGASGLEGKALTASSIRAGLDTLNRFNRLAKSRGVDETLAVATAAVREAPNGGDFLAEVVRQTGIQARVISGAEEARLIYKAALYGVESQTGKTVVIDIGGGTTEVAVGTAAGARIARSFRLGVIRLTERFVKSDPLSEGDERRLTRHVRREVGPFLTSVATEGFDRVVLTSGTALNLGEMALRGAALFHADTIHHGRISAKQLHRVRKQIVGSDMKARLRLPGLDSRRVDLIVAGAVLADALVRQLGADEVTLCDFALREGLILDFVEQNRGHIAQVDRYPDIRRRSVIELAERCRYYPEHTAQVARLAVSLFDQTRHLHGLDDRAREWLEFAALLHDIGGHIAYQQHHKHSQYLILNGGLRGFEPAEVQVIALVARYHRRGPPKKSNTEYAKLSPVLRRTVRVAAALLRVAESLDRSHAAAVSQVEFRGRGDDAVLLIRGEGETELELWATRRQIGPLAKVLRTKIDVKAIHGDAPKTAAARPGRRARPAPASGGKNKAEPASPRAARTLPHGTRRGRHPARQGLPR